MTEGVHQGVWVRRSRTFVAANGTANTKPQVLRPPSRRQMMFSEKPPSCPSLIIYGFPLTKQLPLRTKTFRQNRFPRDHNYSLFIIHYSLFTIHLFNHVHSHIRSQNLRHGYAAVGVLIVFKNCSNGSADRNARAVEGVNKLCLVLCTVLVAD